MASVGELFKFLGSNDVFLELCKDTEKTSEQIIADVFENEELIAQLRNIIQDDSIIKSKMDILIGQKRKNQNKKQEQKQNQDKKQEEQKQDDKQEDKQEEENKKEFKHVPINPSKVIYLDNFAYIELVDHRMRLVTHDYEMYY
jgi:FKBP-type peptidyl-prolyl cis-trans isomerase